MIASPKRLNRDGTPREDHFVCLRGATWKDYERVLEIRGDRSAPRIAYMDGTLESKLRVPEVWIWRHGQISVHVLQGRRYERVRGSEALPGIDLEQLASLLGRESTSAAIREYRAALRTGSSMT